MATQPNMPKAAPADPLAAAKQQQSQVPVERAGVGLLQQQREIEDLKRQIAQQNANQEKLLAAISAQNSAPVTVAAKTVISKAKGKITVQPPAPCNNTLAAEIERLRKENAALRDAQKPATASLSCKVSDKGAVSVYGLGHWPVTLYREQWERLISFAPQVSAFIAANGSKLKTK